MAFDVKPILRAGVAVQSTALLTENVKLAKLALKKKKSQKKIVGKIVKTGMINIVGIPLLQAQSQLISKV